jgi:hypothetical protein
MELKADETGAAIVPVLACVLNQLCTRNDMLPINQQGVTKFHALRPPAISIRDYLERIGKYAACSGECFVLALVYIDRIIQTNPTFVVNSLNIHRLLITSVMLAAKFFDDQYFNNAYYAKVGGVPAPEMNTLEVEFLFMTNFTLFVPTDTYRQYYTELCNHAQNSTCDCTTQKIPELIIPTFPSEGDYINSTQGLVHVPQADITNHHGSFHEASSGGAGGVDGDESMGDVKNMQMSKTLAGGQGVEAFGGLSGSRGSNSIVGGGSEERDSAMGIPSGTPPVGVM